jgi:hypothetical protein
MPLLRKAVLQPVLGLDYSQPASYLDFRNTFPMNVRYSEGTLRKREGTQGLGSTISGANGVMHHAIYSTQSENIRLMRMSKTKLEQWNESTTSWDDKTGGSDMTGGDTQYFDTAVAENTLVGTNYHNTLWKYVDGDAGRSVLSASAPVCKFLEYLSPYLVAGYVTGGTNYHLKVQWTDTGDITDWNTGNAGSALLAHDPDPLRGLLNLNEYQAAYKKNAIYLGRKVDTSDVIKWDLVEVGTGLMNHRCVIEHQGLHYFMGMNDFRVFNGVRSQSIGGPVRDRVFRQRNPDQDTAHWALHAKDYDEIWFFVVMGSDTYPANVYKYNYRNNFWYEDTAPSYRHGVEWFRQASVTIDDLVGTIDAQAGIIDDYLSTTNSPTYVFGDNSGQTIYGDRSVSNDNGVAIDGRFETIDFVGETFERYKRWLQFDFWGKGNEVTVSYSTDEGSTWTSLGATTLTGTWTPYRLYFDVYSEKIRFRFQNNTASETFHVRQFYPYYLVREEQNT